ncbi:MULTISPECIES: AAA family ATPase [unclassified Myroides]|uniref:AAA family ATPase n=1 Tax=unclassified Myroides TaxID=2642485 RepID=UPI003D2F9B39
MNTSYISSTQLSGYKSIDDVSIEFTPSLNIIIGKNAAGKTNFLNYLNDSLNFKFEKYNNFNSSYVLKSNENIFNFSFSKKTVLNFTENFKLKTNSSFKGHIALNSNELKSDIKINHIDEAHKLSEFLENHNIQLYSKLIRHGIPKNYPIIETPLNIDLIINGDFSDDFFKLYHSEQIDSSFFKKVLFSLINEYIINGEYFNNRLKNKESIDKYIEKVKTDYKQTILSRLHYIQDLKSVLLSYSPIENIRLNENFLVEIDNQEKNISIKNFYLEFFIDKKWYTFDDLSDGTRRIFYILSELFTVDLNGTNNENKKFQVVMIEEPELGIHPHQLLKLMSYIKERSKFIQIIITTHSPLTLDILEKSELDSILIAAKVEGKTVLKKLDEVKKEKASLYMDELELSNYWINSDLED